MKNNYVDCRLRCKYCDGDCGSEVEYHKKDCPVMVEMDIKRKLSE